MTKSVKWCRHQLGIVEYIRNLSKSFERIHSYTPIEDIKEAIENMKTNVNSNSNSNFNSYSDAVSSSIDNINHEDCNQPASQQNEGFSSKNDGDVDRTDDYNDVSP